MLPCRSKCPRRKETTTDDHKDRPNRRRHASLRRNAPPVASAEPAASGLAPGRNRCKPLLKKLRFEYLFTCIRWRPVPPGHKAPSSRWTSLPRCFGNDDSLRLLMESGVSTQNPSMSAMAIFQNQLASQVVAKATAQRLPQRASHGARGKNDGPNCPCCQTFLATTL